eukprot:COSAG06_NODE_37227_length_437_cov_3.943787_1_plen_88_part_00
MAERMTTAEMMWEYNRMRLERGDSSVSAPAAGSENPELAQMAALLDEAGSLLEKGRGGGGCHVGGAGGGVGGGAGERVFFEERDGLG